MSTPVTFALLKPAGLGTAVTPGVTGGSSSAAGGGFSATLQDMLGQVEDSSSAANDAVSKMIDGTGDVHEAMIALQHADVMLQMTVQIRNKLVQAYQDVMRMPV
jgi:flagellar hook-basal body complex protein FliE